jgi:hypothetical protein
LNNEPYKILKALYIFKVWKFRQAKLQTAQQSVRCKGANAKPAAIVFLQPINKDLQTPVVVLIVPCFTYKMKRSKEIIMT